MPDAEQTKPAADDTDEEAAPEEFDGPSISGYGVGSAALKSRRCCKHRSSRRA